MSEPRTRTSRKRDAILKALLNTKRHPSAESIYAALKPEFPDLSLGTVYTNLAAFKREHKAVSVAVVNGKERFDGNVSPHAHFICLSCGAVLDTDAEMPRQPDVDGVVTSCTLNWYGYCARCTDHKSCTECNCGAE